MNIFRLLLFSLCTLLAAQTFPISANTPQNESDSLFLHVVLPEEETFTFAGHRYRVAASTLPSAEAFINDRSVRVYPTGAFVGLVNLQHGDNTVILRVVGAAGDTLSKSYTIHRPEPMQSSPRDPLVIENIMMLPDRDYWLQTGDILEVRFKGSPGYEASFEIENLVSGVVMEELPPERANGLEGIYVGMYEVQPDDYVRDARIRFRLRKSFWSSEYRYADAKVSILTRDFPMIVRLVGSRPFLNAGLGTDRLGGAKLGFLEEGVRLPVTGMVGNQYRVRLSPEMTAWLPTRFAEPTDDRMRPQALTGSISVVGTHTRDVVTLSLGERLPYLSRQETEPTSIVIDIYGASSNTNWVTHHLSAIGIDNITWQQVAEEQFRLTIRLVHRQHWGHSIEYDGYGNMKIVVRRPPQGTSPDDPLQGIVIAVDAGHGGDNNGALGSTGSREKDLNLSMAMMVDSILTGRGATVVMMRGGDYNVGMTERVQRVLASDADILVSIHCNSIGLSNDPELVHGTSTYYRHVGYKPLADIMYQRMLALGLGEFGVVGSFNFTLNDILELPNVLVEVAFMSHPEDEMKLLNIDFQRQVAAQIVDGLEAFIVEYR
jgi:N-acetylmuramoyl-L-alanine amidase